MVSALAVYRDVLPGYRIRLPTEKELEAPVSKDVKKVRDHETALLRSYQVIGLAYLACRIGHLDPVWGPMRMITRRRCSEATR
jgi:Nucleolar complex-associated protein